MTIQGIDLTCDRAWKLLEDPARWMKHGSAVSQDDMPVRPSDPCAVRWCMLGAVERIHGNNEATWPKTVAIIKRRLGTRTVSEWNDASGRTHAEVLTVLKELDL